MIEYHIHVSCGGPCVHLACVLAAGGEPDNGGPSLASAEVYNPTSGQLDRHWPLTQGPLLFPDGAAPHGNVLAAGGFDNSNGYNSLASAEVYSPSTGNWTATGSLATARSEFQMVLLPDGNVLAAGGYDFNSNKYNGLTSAEV